MNKPFVVDPVIALSDHEASQRLAEEGYNELPSAKPRHVLAIALSVAREPMFMLVVACGAIYLLLGSRQEALMLLGFVFVVMGITFVQERKTERALGALRDLSSPRALVIRGGRQKRIPGRDVVRGDIVVLVEGDRVPADAILLECTSMTVDEAVLTSESVPVRKLANDGPQQGIGVPGGDDLPFVFSGTLVVQGKGMAEVFGHGNWPRRQSLVGNQAGGHPAAKRNGIRGKTRFLDRSCTRSDRCAFGTARLAATG